MILTWITVILVLGLIQFITISITTMYFIISAFITLILSFIIPNVFIQFGIFILLGLILLIFFKELITKLYDKVKPKFTEKKESMVGKKGIVLKKIYKDSVGEVYIDGKRYKAKSEDVIKSHTDIIVIELIWLLYMAEDE